MKKIIILLALVLTIVSCQEETTYCGVVIEMFRTDAGYKSRPEAHIVFYCDSINRNIDVEVGFNTYANTTIGDKICFELNDYQLRK